MEELKSKYEILKFEHRSMLFVNDNFKRYLLKDKEEIRNLEAKKNALITEKDNAILKGAHAFKDFHEIKLQVEMERDRAISVKNAFASRENMIRSRLLIENDDEFEWAARVIDNARTGLSTNVSLESDRAEVVKAIISKKEDIEKKHLQEINDLKLKLSARDSKYGKLKKKFIVSISNMKKDSIRLRDEHVKKNAEEICAEYQIPLSDFKPSDVEPNEEDIEIYDSEVVHEEYEETDEEDNGSGSGEDSEFEEDLGGDSSKGGGNDKSGK
ncbi:uncharacterized protein LOC113339388 [Papaver somniferum]|uniref:uncharacterized protein LOC113339388 n=1 Tax=Papaver somniferum TaxID=3469 RepID=UPI000E6F6162|nr:uncharacterized protein LOC113339388 [Papaver somniferum]